MMSTLASQHLITADHLQLIATLPADARLFLPDVPWEEYEYLLSQITDSSSLRLSYDQGRLEIMTLSPRHESLKVLFTHLLSVLTKELKLGFISLGSMTFKLPEAARGTEPDDCFYIRRAALVEDRDTIDLEIDPGPDLVVEIDLSHPSLNKLPIYASLDVTEVWIYNGQQMRFYLLAGDVYEEILTSDLFPFLAPGVVATFLKPGKIRDIHKMTEAFQDWVQAHKNDQ